ncbi:MACPF domain-containing protein CAD1-like isoform X1 [Amaranthus tricolor]|uniref:MACPF domain-containing protein CAD1-like isoform X1 n=2 Tax=Amaranthus tricolor TaxID=29722 RepID=UPI002589386D|nr:MACPF domain-containing protein CAD1-like isoform X1 [Amaranthus tricolor]
MDGNEAALYTAVNAIQALGRGFDVNFDTRLLYCKGIAGSRIFHIDEEPTWDLRLSDNLIVPNVPRSINYESCRSGRESFGACSYDEMVNHFNKKADLSANIPLGSFNAAFNFTGSKHIDAASTKSLSVDGFVFPLAKIQLSKSAWVLQENVIKAIPTVWDPPSLASFIENYGTHVITSVTIGGKDVFYVKQHQSSPLSAIEMKIYVQEIGKQRFLHLDSQPSSGPIRVKDKVGDSSLFNSQGIYPQPTSVPSVNGKEDITVIFRRRGGDDLEQSHKQWAKTVKSSPDIIDMTFAPITDLIKDSARKEYLRRAITLYLEYKPPIEELRYFLEFQIPRVWAPVHNRHPGHQRKEPVCPSLQFSLMGQKLYISQEQVSVGRKPVTGLRLFLEGVKQNRLSIHLQHLVSLPKILIPYWDTHVAIGAPKWLGPEEQDSRWFEPVKWKNFSHVSTAPIESHETFAGEVSGVHIVTGAQLGVWDFGSRNVLYMKLLYSRLPGCTIRRSLWDHTPVEKPNKSGGAECSSGDSSSGSSGTVSGNKLVKFVDMSEMKKGPEDLPGHWLVTGGKLGIEKGKIILRVKYSLLNY